VLSQDGLLTVWNIPAAVEPEQPSAPLAKPQLLYEINVPLDVLGLALCEDFLGMRSF
jgi:hypothetical protein